MGLTKYKLGELIEIVDLRNKDRDNKYTEKNVKGISTDKKFIATKANLEGVSLNSYRVVDPKSFAYVADTSRRGDKISLAFNITNEVIIVSSISTIFKVKREELLDPNFLFMYFNRTEFDRFSRFNSWGSARETFSWEDFCDIEINLPSIEIQKKYVAIYEAMLKNQEVYEEGLEDLKLTCDATIEEFRRKMPSDKIGPFISRGIKNTDGEFTKVLGIGGAGFIQPQKKPNKSLKNYKIMREGAIVYAPPLYNINSNAIHLYTNNYVSVCSPIYEVFYTDKNILLPEYLILWLKREEFKRYAAFNALGVRNTFDYNLMEEFLVPIPPIEIQNSIANIYKVYTERKEINEKLKEQIKSICPILIKGAMEEACREGIEMEDLSLIDKFSEEELEKAIISLFEKEGYEYSPGDSIHRRFEDILLEDDLKTFLKNRYAEDNLTDLELKTIINKISNISSSPIYLASREAFLLTTEGFNLEREDKSKLALHVSYINFDHPENNIFKVVNQYSVKDKELRRPDLLIFVNGIPVTIFEFKTAISEDTTIYDAWQQINIRYKRDLPSLVKYCFLSVISDGANTRMGSIFTPYKFYYAWNKINDHESARDGISSLLTMIKGAFSKRRLLSILRDFIFYPDDSQKEEVIVCRYPQFFAATKMFENIKRELKPMGSGKGGTYFGATGSGKTYTMLYLSRLLMLRESEVFSNPTILIITDREDLDTQTSELFITAKRFLHEDNVRSIESRKDLKETLDNKPSGGVYLTTIQKFSEDIGLLSERKNIICISDEAHRTQTGTGSKLKKTDKGVFTSYGFAKYLRDSFPNATYAGFTGTPIDETIAVFGGVVDSYTMKESSDDGITERIAYEPRLARVIISEEKSIEIEKYYKKCFEEGSTEEQIEESKKAMSRMSVILGDPDRLWKMAQDIVDHYEKLSSEKPEVVQKAMIVCSTREIAFNLLNNILKLRPSWGESKKSDRESKLSKEELNKLVALAKINLVATRGANDEESLYKACGTKEYRKMLDRQFKNNNSNFKIAVVVDMWITGFDVPSLAVMYIDKPLQKHTLIQTISRVNRVFDGKDKGLVVDYIGIKRNMMEAIKIYGGEQESPVDELETSLKIYRNYLALIEDVFLKFDKSKFLNGEPLERLICLNEAAEFIQTKKETQKEFMGLSRRLKAAYNICFPSGELTDREVSQGQFYLAVRSIIYKQTKGTAPDAEVMNEVVEKMVTDAIQCTGVENIVDEQKTIDLFSEDFIEHLDQVKLPITKFNALLKLLRKTISDYGKTNKIKALEFSERLKKVVDEYNSRDNLEFVNEVTEDFVNNLSDELIRLMRDLENDRNSFEKMGISYEEKAFYDILINVRDKYEFPYEDEKCIVLAKKIKELVNDKSQYTDWSNRNDIKSQLKMDLVILLYENGYPPQWSEEVFDMVLEQAENYKN